MHTVFEIANFFLSKESMSNKKLQKLVYYAYSWTLALLNEPELSPEDRDVLFEERIEAWVHGPVIPELYREYKKYGWQNIPKKDIQVDVFNEDIINILEQVWTIYGELNGDQLEYITHNELPWKDAREGLGNFEPSNTSINSDTIYRYYYEAAVKNA